MKSNYKRIGDYIRLVDERNRGLKVTILLGLTIDKLFIPSVANIIETDMANYKIIRKGQFACSLMQVRRDKRMPVALLAQYEEAIISPAYPVFEITDTEELLPEYLMMWMSRPEFDRHACFLAVGGVRGSLEWVDFCDIELPIPSIEKQREIVREYNVVVNRIKLNERMNQKLEKTAQAIYKQWFVDFDFPMTKEYAASIGKPELEGKPYKSSGGEMVDGEGAFSAFPRTWKVSSLKKITCKIGSGATPKGGKTSYQDAGLALIRSLNIWDYNFIYDDLAFISDAQAKKLSNVEVLENDVLINITGVSVARCYQAPKNILPARVNQHVAIVRPDLDVKISNYLVCALCSTDYKSRLLGDSEGGSTRQALTKADLEKCEILMPDKEVLCSFERLAYPIFSKKERLSEEGLALLKTKLLILSRMATINEVVKDAA